jgi:hypothetical protein
MRESTNEGAVLRVLPRETFVAGLFEAGMIAMNGIEWMACLLRCQILGCVFQGVLLVVRSFARSAQESGDGEA